MTTITTTLPAEVRQAVERLSRLDQLGALAAEEAAEVRTLVAFVTGRGAGQRNAFELGRDYERGQQRA